MLRCLPPLPPRLFRALGLPCALQHPKPDHSVLFARSVQIAVLKELEGKGTYCSLVAAVVVVKDVVLFAAFAVNVELARTLVGGSEGSTACRRV